MTIYQDSDGLGGTGGIWEVREVARFRRHFGRRPHRI